MSRLAAVVGAVPTTASSWRRMAGTVRRAMTTPAGAVAAVISAGAYLSLFALPGNISALVRLLTSSLPISRKVTIFLSVYPPFSSEYSAVESIFIIALTGLVAANGAVLVHRWQGRPTGEAGSATAMGLVGGVIGTGCGACGSLLVPLTGLSAAVAALPFGGVSILLGSAAVLVVALASGTDACTLPEQQDGATAIPPD